MPGSPITAALGGGGGSFDLGANADSGNAGSNATTGTKNLGTGSNPNAALFNQSNSGTLLIVAAIVVAVYMIKRGA